MLIYVRPHLPFNAAAFPFPKLITIYTLGTGGHRTNSVQCGADCVCVCKYILYRQVSLRRVYLKWYVFEAPLCVWIYMFTAANVVHRTVAVVSISFQYLHKSRVSVYVSTVNNTAHRISRPRNPAHTPHPVTPAIRAVGGLWVVENMTPPHSHGHSVPTVNIYTFARTWRDGRSRTAVIKNK